MHYIKDIFEKNITEHAHNKFIRYSKGTFVGPLAKIKISKANIKMSASFHYVEELLELFAELVDDRIMHIKGFLIWNKDLTEDLARLGIKYAKVSKSRGIFKYTIENDVNVKDFIKTFNKYHLLITIKSEDISIVSKSVFPKPNKEFSHDFCKVIFPISAKKKILEEFAFDIEPTKDILIRHEIIVDNINIPEADSFDEARRLATREGVLTRIINDKVTKIKFKV